MWRRMELVMLLVYIHGDGDGDGDVGDSRFHNDLDMMMEMV